MTHNNLLELTCSKCGARLDAGSQPGWFVCSHCGSAYREPEPDGMEKLQEGMQRVEARLQDVQARVQRQSLPMLFEERARFSRQILEHARLMFTSMAVFGFGFFLNKVLIFSPNSGWIRYLPDGVMLIGAGVFAWALVQVILVSRKRATLERGIPPIPR